MGPLSSFSNNRYPGRLTVLTEFWGMFIWVGLGAIALGAKTFPGNVEFLARIVRNYSSDAVTIGEWTYLLLLISHVGGSRVRWARPLVWSRWLMWVIPTLGLGVGYGVEMAQFAENP